MKKYILPTLIIGLFIAGAAFGAQNNAKAAAAQSATSLATFSDPILGLTFSYPSDLATSTLTDGNFLKITTLQDAIASQNAAEQCGTSCPGPDITIANWKAGMKIFETGSFSTSTCPSCRTLTTVGANQFLEESASSTSGSPIDRYISYHNDTRYEFDIPADDPQIQATDMAILSGVTFDK